MAIKKNGKKDQNLLHKRLTKIIIIVMALGFVIPSFITLFQIWFS